MNNIHTNSKDLNLIIKNIKHNNCNIELILNKISKLNDKEEIMISQIKINHLIMLNNFNRKILLKKFKNNIKIFNKIIYKHLENKNRDVNEELIFLYILSLENKFIEPNVCDEVLRQLINKLISILNNLNIKNYIINYSSHQKS
jgi:hypothetical protein